MNAVPDHSLVATRHVVAAWIAAGVSLAVLVVMSVGLHDRHSTAFDTWCGSQLLEHIGSTGRRVLIDLSLPVVSVTVPALVVLGAIWKRRWDLAAVAVFVPVAGTVLAEQVGKPVVHRLLSTASSFPSGHETGIASAAFVLCLALAQLPLRRGVQLAWRVAASAYVLAAAAGLVRAGDHYATDTVGALALVVALGLTSALLVDRVRLPRRARDYALS